MDVGSGDGGFVKDAMSLSFLNLALSLHPLYLIAFDRFLYNNKKQFFFLILSSRYPEV